jgi:hypothetical protein
MKKTLGCIGLVLVLSVFGFTQTAAAAFERDARGGHAPKEPRQSREKISPGQGAEARVMAGHHHQEVRPQRSVHYERRLPAGYLTLRIADMMLYYLNGIFYQSTPYGYEVVNAPMGAVVSQLPPGYYRILNGYTPYYVYNNIYYVRGPIGYVVTPAPQVVMLPAQSGW